MIAQTRKPLGNVERFYGSGVYAIYYNGAFPAYAAISKKEHPIYVGKADPAKRSSNTAMEQGDKLSGRLKEHKKNIGKATTTLRLEDFEYRALVVQSGWQDAAETYLIDLFNRSGTTRLVFVTASVSTATRRKLVPACARRGTPCITAAIGRIAIRI